MNEPTMPTERRTLISSIHAMAGVCVPSLHPSMRDICAAALAAADYRSLVTLIGESLANNTDYHPQAMRAYADLWLVLADSRLLLSDLH